MPATARFYAEVLRLRLIEGPTDLSAALRLEDGGVLLIFDPERASAPGRPVPSHGASGPGHVAFSIATGGLDAFADTLRRQGVVVEQQATWHEGGRSVYLRDPAGNSVELIEGEAWRPTRLEASG